jgi:hypothetical protein
MPRKRFTSEQIISKLREAEVRLARANPSLMFVAPWLSLGKLSIDGATSSAV